MKPSFVVWILAALVSVPAFAIYKKGDTIPNTCWKNELDKNVCLDDYKKNLRVLLYNAGWCPPCNEEFRDLIPQMKQFDKKPVAFISISAEGNTHGSKPDAAFLKYWKNKYKIPFQTTGSYRDFGKSFFAPPNYIPSVVILDSDGKLIYTAVNPGADAIVDEVLDLLK